jgi:hypothetical protein
MYEYTYIYFSIYIHINVCIYIGDIGTSIERNLSGDGVKVVLLPDLRVGAEKSEMIRALWERLHRAASGIFVQ